MVTYCTHNLGRRLDRSPMEIKDAVGLVLRIETVLQLAVLGGDARRTLVRVAFQGLDTAKAHHECSRGTCYVGSQRKCPSQRKSTANFARGNNSDFGPHTSASQEVSNHDQPFL